MASVTAVHPGGHPTAPSTPRPTSSWVGGDHYPAVDLVDPVDHHRRQLRKQNPTTALTSHNPECTPAERRRAHYWGRPRPLHGEWARTIKRGRRQCKKTANAPPWTTWSPACPEPGTPPCPPTPTRGGSGGLPRPAAARAGRRRLHRHRRRLTPPPTTSGRSPSLRGKSADHACPFATRLSTVRGLDWGDRNGVIREVARTIVHGA